MVNAWGMFGKRRQSPGIVCTATSRLINGYKDACLAFLLLLSQPESTLLTRVATAWQLGCGGAAVHTSGVQGDSTDWGRVTVPLCCGPWCRDTPQVEDRYCYSIASTFCFQTHHLFWLCPGEVFMCMNFSAITLALLFMSITSKEKKRKKMPPLQFFYQRMLSVPSRLFSAFPIIICLQ